MERSKHPSALTLSVECRIGARVLGPCALSLFDLLSSGGEDADSSSGRSSCPRDSLANSAVSDGSEEEVVGFDNSPGILESYLAAAANLIALSR